MLPLAVLKQGEKGFSHKARLVHGLLSDEGRQQVSPGAAWEVRGASWEKGQGSWLTGAGAGNTECSYPWVFFKRKLSLSGDYFYSSPT